MQNDNNTNNNNKNIFFQSAAQTKMNEISNKIKIIKDQKIETLKPRSYTFDTKKSNPNSIPIKLNLGNLNFLGNGTMKNYINILGNNNNDNLENKKNIFLNTNKLPKIITRLSLSNFHKKSNNNNDIPVADSNNKGTINKFNIFNRTSGGMGFKGITFNNGLDDLRSTNYKFNNINNLNSCKNYHIDNIKIALSKDKILSPNNTKYNKNVMKDINNINCLQFNNTNIINNNGETKEKKPSHINKNLFNKKTVIHNNNKYYNNMNINQVNNNLILFKNKKEKDEIKEKSKGKENEEKNNLCEENNDSLLNEFHDLFSNVKENNDFLHFQENLEENNKNNDSDDDDKEPDPRINFEQISRVNQSRPQTSYGGLVARRKNLQSAIQNERNKKNRPTTSNVPE